MSSCHTRERLSSLLLSERFGPTDRPASRARAVCQQTPCLGTLRAAIMDRARAAMRATLRKRDARGVSTRCAPTMSRALLHAYAPRTTTIRLSAPRRRSARRPRSILTRVRSVLELAKSRTWPSVLAWWRVSRRAARARLLERRRYSPTRRRIGPRSFARSAGATCQRRACDRGELSQERANVYLCSTKVVALSIDEERVTLLACVAAAQAVRANENEARDKERETRGE